MSIDRKIYFGVVFDAGDQDLTIGENENSSLLWRPFCQNTGKESKYWLPNRRGGFCLEPSPCGSEHKIVLPGLLVLPMVVEEFLSKHNISGVREIIYVEYYM